MYWTPIGFRWSSTPARSALRSCSINNHTGDDMDLSDLTNLPWNTIIPIVISLAALTVSILSWYFNNLAPFRPLITVGFPMYHLAILVPSAPNPKEKEGIEYDPVKGRILALIVIPFVFTHRGGRSGIISDLMLRVTHEQESTNWYFEPRLIMNQQVFIPKPQPQDILKSIDSPFAPIPIAKGKDANRIVMFQPKHNDSFPFGRLIIGKYSVQVLCRVNKKHRFKEIYRVEADFSKEVLQSLSTPGYYVPEPRSVTDARDKLCGPMQS